MAEIDTRFLTPDARITRWMAIERTQCAECLNCQQFPDGEMRCAAAALNCIDAREPGAACGPEAALHYPMAL